MKVNRGHCHDYLGMIFDYSTMGEVKIDMRYYVEAMVEDFEYEHGKLIKNKKEEASTPHTATLFTVNDNPVLTENRNKFFTHMSQEHYFYASKHAQMCN